MHIHVHHVKEQTGNFKQMNLNSMKYSAQSSQHIVYVSYNSIHNNHHLLCAYKTIDGRS